MTRLINSPPAQSSSEKRRCEKCGLEASAHSLNKGDKSSEAESQARLEFINRLREQVIVQVLSGGNADEIASELSAQLREWTSLTNRIDLFMGILRTAQQLTNRQIGPDATQMISRAEQLTEAELDNFKHNLQIAISQWASFPFEVEILQGWLTSLNELHDEELLALIKSIPSQASQVILKLAFQRKGVFLP